MIRAFLLALAFLVAVAISEAASGVLFVEMPDGEVISIPGVGDYFADEQGMRIVLFEDGGRAKLDNLRAFFVDDTAIAAVLAQQN